VEVMLRDTARGGEHLPAIRHAAGALAAVTESNTGDFAVKAQEEPQPPASQKSKPSCARKIAEQFPMLQVEFVQCCRDMIAT